MVRINGAPLSALNSEGDYRVQSVIESLYKSNADMEGLYERLLYSKAEKWASEEEVRIVCPLSECEVKTGVLVKPVIDSEIYEKCSQVMPMYHEINLKKIPFEAFNSIILGYDMSERNKLDIIRLIKENESLKDVRLQAARHNIYGDIDIVEYSQDNI